MIHNTSHRPKSTKTGKKRCRQEQVSEPNMKRRRHSTSETLVKALPSKRTLLTGLRSVLVPTTLSSRKTEERKVFATPKGTGLRSKPIEALGKPYGAGTKAVLNLVDKSSQCRKGKGSLLPSAFSAKKATPDIEARNHHKHRPPTFEAHGKCFASTAFAKYASRTSSMSDQEIEASISCVLTVLAKEQHLSANSAEEEHECREIYQHWHPVYVEIIERIEHMSGISNKLKKDLEMAGTSQRRNAVIEGIELFVNENKKQHKRLTQALPILHRYLRRVRYVLDDWATAVQNG